VNRREVHRDNRTLEFHRTPEVANPSAVIRRTSENSVGGDRAVEQIHGAGVIKNTATHGASGTARDVATDRAALHIDGAVVIRDAAALTPTAPATAHGRIAADRGSIQLRR